MPILMSGGNGSYNHWSLRNHMIMLMEESFPHTLISIQCDGGKGDNSCKGDRQRKNVMLSA